MSKDSGRDYHEKFDAAFEEEIAHVERRSRAKEARRGTRPEQISFDRKSLRGLALSGGGIRSASFCMGVVQHLYVSGILDRLHYMSTVSGGGYTGSSLSWFMTKGFGTGREAFPFWGGDPAGRRNQTQQQPVENGGTVDGRAVVDYIRQRSSYLNPGDGFTVLSAAAILLRSILVSILGFVLVFALLYLAGRELGLFERPLADARPSLPAFLGFLPELDWFGITGFALLLLIPVSIVVYSIGTGLPTAGRWTYGLRRAYQRWAGTILLCALALLLIGMMHSIVAWLLKSGLSLEALTAAAGGSTAAGGAGGLLIRGVKDAEPTARLRRLIVLLPPLFLFLLVVGLAALGVLLARFLDWLGWDFWQLLILTVFYAVVTNINLTGLHRFYRDRLMESFMPDPTEIPADRQAAETPADKLDLADVCGIEHDGPYQLINTNVVLLGAKKARQRSRTGDSFVLSPCFCGSEATGFIRTRAWLPGPAGLAITRRVGAMKLPTAMAISGAALNPRTGADGQGPTKGGAISALLTLLNLRLGYWVPSPKKAQTPLKLSYRAAPNFLFPGLRQGLFGMQHNEEANWLELSDGGHFENTGIYELVRRGVRTVIFADGSTDPEITLSSFANVLEKIYIDFGVTVQFDPQHDFVRMLKGTAAPPGDRLNELLKLAEAGFAIATIKYPDGAPGTLFYIKSTMIREVPAALYSYKATNPLFPSESLADQFFSEQQFEAYRALGYALAEQMTNALAKNAKAKDALGL